MKAGLTMKKHNPIQFTTAMSAKLASRSRHVCAFLGAGTSQACGLPGVVQLQDKVLPELDAPGRKVFETELKTHGFEGALTRIRRIAALVGDQEFGGLTEATAKSLDAAICKSIVKALGIESADLAAAKNLAAWVARSDYDLPVELFTVNYDLLLETALEHHRVPYFDGFSGTLRARFNTELVEGKPGTDREWIPAFFARLWKLHGSVNWAWAGDGQIVRLGHPVADGESAAIFPSDTKYEESRRVPFVVLQDRFRRALHEPETFVLISGYSFGDDHLNDMIFDAALHRPRSEFQVFCYDDIPEVLVERALTTPNLQVCNGLEAILGGVRADWEAPESAPKSIWNDGHFVLRDFKQLAVHLARSVAPVADRGTLLQDVIEKAISAERTEEGAGGDA